ncbi:hypothetical protein GQ44DRAFT_707506 [Phaeosphaeriaceae sp. PMI808]|nr:hypothetical protein GQ44DRAFT_707506 [Phaeosphaeriaceae sp. PMI808]
MGCLRNLQTLSLWLMEQVMGWLNAVYCGMANQQIAGSVKGSEILPCCETHGSGRYQGMKLDFYASPCFLIRNDKQFRKAITTYEIVACLLGWHSN